MRKPHTCLLWRSKSSRVGVSIPLSDKESKDIRRFPMASLNNQPVGEQQDYVRLSCNHILQATKIDSESEHSEPAASDAEVDPGLMVETPPKSSQLKIQRQRADYVRVLALLCACSLSVGSH